MVAPAARKQTDMTLSPSPGRELLRQHSSNCHERHWGPSGTSAQLVWLGSGEVAPQPCLSSAAPRNLSLPRWSFYQLGLTKGFSFPPYSREKLSLESFLPRIPPESSACTWFWGCETVIHQCYPGFGGKAERRGHLCSRYHCTAVIESNIFLRKNASKYLLKYEILLKALRGFAFRSTSEKHMVPF